MDSIIVDGVERFMGNRRIDNVPRTYRWQYVPDKVPIIPKDQWEPVDLVEWLPPVKDQNGIGACNAFATVEVAETCRAVQGLTYLKLSPGYLYGCINGQQDQGSMLEDAMAWMVNHGTCLSSTTPDLAWRKNQWGANSAAEAGKYRFLECYVCPEGVDLIASMVSALMDGFVLDTGALWYNSYNPDKTTGRLPKQKKGLAGGHAFCVYGFDLDTDGVWFKFRNSWGESWGQNGNALIHESAYTNDIGGIYACRSFSDQGSNFPQPVSNAPNTDDNGNP